MFFFHILAGSPNSWCSFFPLTLILKMLFHYHLGSSVADEMSDVSLISFFSICNLPTHVVLKIVVFSFYPWSSGIFQDA